MLSPGCHYQNHTRKENRMIDVIKENWVAFYILWLSIITAIGKWMIRKHVWKENNDERPD